MWDHRLKKGQCRTSNLQDIILDWEKLDTEAHLTCTRLGRTEMKLCLLKQFSADVEMVLQRSSHSTHEDTICVPATALSDVASGNMVPLGGLIPSHHMSMHAPTSLQSVT